MGAGRKGGDQCQTPSSTHPQLPHVQNLMMHFSYDKQDFSHLHTSKKKSFLFSLTSPLFPSLVQPQDVQKNKQSCSLLHFQADHVSFSTYYMLLNATHADPIIKTFATVPWPHAFAQLFFIDLSTERPVFPPLCSHLRHFSCHSWRQTI